MANGFIRKLVFILLSSMRKGNLTIITMSVLLLAAATVMISVTVSEDTFARDGRYSSDFSFIERALPVNFNLQLGRPLFCDF